MPTQGATGGKGAASSSPEIAEIGDASASIPDISGDKSDAIKNSSTSTGTHLSLQQPLHSGDIYIFQNYLKSNAWNKKYLARHASLPKAFDLQNDFFKKTGLEKLLTSDHTKRTCNTESKYQNNVGQWCGVVLCEPYSGHGHPTNTPVASGTSSNLGFVIFSMAHQI